MHIGITVMDSALRRPLNPVVDLVANGSNEAALMSTAPAIEVVRGTLTQSSDFAQSGSFSAKYTSDAVGSATHYVVPFGNAVPMQGDTAYTFDIWLYIPSSWTGAGIKLIDTVDGSWIGGQVTTKDAWTRIQATRAAKGSNWVFAIGQNNAENVDGQSFYIDNLSVIAG